MEEAGMILSSSFPFGMKKPRNPYELPEIKLIKMKMPKPPKV
jgi:hypothetical protein